MSNLPMRKSDRLTNAEIGQKVAAGKTFEVATNNERKLALAAASFASKSATSRKNPKGGYIVFFI